MADSQSVLPAIPLPPTDWEKAARLLEQSVRAGNQDPQAAYLLAMCCKRLGRFGDARQSLDRIREPDANVLLQRGVLAFRDRDHARAAREFAAALALHPESFPAAYDLVLSWLCLGERGRCLEALPQAIACAPSPEYRRTLLALKALLVLASSAGGPEGGTAADPESLRLARADLDAATAEDEGRLVELLTGLGRFDLAFPLLSQLVSVRPGNPQVFAAYVGAALVEARLQMDRCRWEEAFSLLSSLQRRWEDGRLSLESSFLMLLHQMSGVCAAMLQDYPRAAWFFRQALDSFRHEWQRGGALAAAANAQGVPQEAALEQNLALILEWSGQVDQAEGHWNHYFDLLEAALPRSMPPDHIPRLAFEGLSRLADVYGKKERWNAALAFLQRAVRFRPGDTDVLERIFQLYTQLRRPEDARRTLRRLRELRPGDPQVELFELEVQEVRNVDDVEPIVSRTRRILQEHPGDMKVEERAATVLTNLVPVMERLAEQATTQLNRVTDQMRRLPTSQVNWPMVRGMMRDLEDRFGRLRRCAQRCQSLLAGEEPRRTLAGLIHHCERKIDQAHALGE